MVNQLVKGGHPVSLTATHAGDATDITWAWTKPADSTAPASTSNVLSWTAAATDGGEYKATATSATAYDSPLQDAVELVVCDPDAYNLIRAMEAADGQPLEYEVQMALHNLATKIKSHPGLWESIYLLHPLSAARTATGGYLPLKNPDFYQTLNVTQVDYSRTLGFKCSAGTYYYLSVFWVELDQTAGKLQFSILLTSPPVVTSGSVLLMQHYQNPSRKTELSLNLDLSSTLAAIQTDNAASLYGPEMSLDMPAFYYAGRSDDDTVHYIAGDSTPRVLEPATRGTNSDWTNGYGVTMYGQGNPENGQTAMLCCYGNLAPGYEDGTVLEQIFREYHTELLAALA
ncbi:MAG: hypothetical protein WBM08_03595 [Prochlorococcaceae cyanobacterium]